MYLEYNTIKQEFQELHRLNWAVFLYGGNYMAKTKVMGKAMAKSKQMQSYIRLVNPKVPQSVLDMVPLYLSEGQAEGVRGDIAFAQSCLETGNFTFQYSAVTLDQNNFCGLGVTRNGMKGNSFATPQQGIRAQIQHLKAYATEQALNQACVDPRYSLVQKGCAPYVEWLGIQENPEGKGWAAGKDYGAKILNILTSITGVQPEQEESMGITIHKKLIGRNQTARKRGKNDIKYIVVHYVGALGGALDNVNYYASGDRGASADFFVGHSGEIYQAVDYYKAYSWHCGGGLQGSSGASHYGKCTNANSIGIEMCVKKKSTATMNATDRDWYFTPQTYEATVSLVKHLMQELNIAKAHVIRHYDVNGKICPNPLVYGTGYTWAGFQAAIGGGSAPSVDTSPWKATGTATCTGDEVNVRETPGGAIIRQLNKGNRFEIDGQTSGSWTHVNVAGTVGWMSTQYVKLDQPAQAGGTAKYKVQAGAYTRKANATALANDIKADGFEAIVVSENGMYKVQCGAFGNKANADSLVGSLKKAGYEAFVRVV